MEDVMKKIKVGLIGIGNRGGMYHDFARQNSELCEVVSIVDFKLQQQLKRIGFHKNWLEPTSRRMVENLTSGRP